MTWQTHDLADVHVTPVNDIIEHDLAWDCVCRPDSEFFDESGRWMYSHHSLDGRETREMPEGWERAPFTGTPYDPGSEED